MVLKQITFNNFPNYKIITEYFNISDQEEKIGKLNEIISILNDCIVEISNFSYPDINALETSNLIIIKFRIDFNILSKAVIYQLIWFIEKIKTENKLLGSEAFCAIDLNNRLATDMDEFLTRELNSIIMYCLFKAGYSELPKFFDQMIHNHRSFYLLKDFIKDLTTTIVASHQQLIVAS